MYTLYIGANPILDEDSVPKEKKLLCGPTECAASPNIININSCTSAVYIYICVDTCR